MYSNTQNSKIAAITEKTLVIGIDIGSETHYARAFNWRGIEFTRKPFIFNNDDEGFEAFRVWIEELKTGHDLNKVMPHMGSDPITAGTLRLVGTDEETIYNAYGVRPHYGVICRTVKDLLCRISKGHESLDNRTGGCQS